MLDYTLKNSYPNARMDTRRVVRNASHVMSSKIEFFRVP